MPWEPRMRHEAGTPRTRGLRAHAVAVLAAAFGLTAPAAGHKPITSPFTFYEDVLPITQTKVHDARVTFGLVRRQRCAVERLADRNPSVQPEELAAMDLEVADRRRLEARDLRVRRHDQLAVVRMLHMKTCGYEQEH